MYTPPKISLANFPVLLSNLLTEVCPHAHANLVGKETTEKLFPDFSGVRFLTGGVREAGIKLAPLSKTL